MLAGADAPIRFKAENTYLLRGMYCLVERGRVVKFPIAAVQRIEEELAA